MAKRTAGTGTSAVVMGDLDLVAPLHQAGVAVTVVAPPGDPIRFSRHRLAVIDDDRPDEEALLARLQAHASTAADHPSLFYESDEDLAFLLANHDALRRDFRFVLGDPALVRLLLDKSSFQRHAQRLGLPVPPAIVLDTHEPVPADLRVALPAIVKPTGGGAGWTPGSTFDGAKARSVHTRPELAAALAAAAPSHRRLMVQQLVPGPESRIESYHAYVDAAGEVVAAFTGRKVRTHPAAFGFTTALVTTDAADVRQLGREVMSTLGLRGVAKLDFKRDDDGRLWLLEVNPRFNLWHHVGAVAGCNLPALVHADLLGIPRPATTTARPGVTWTWLPRDLLTARAQGASPRAYARWLRQCDAFGGTVPSDPWPFVRGRLWPMARGRLRSSRRTAATAPRLATPA